MNEVFKLRPSFPKYAETYDVRKVLDYLETIQTSMLTPLKELSQKLSMLLCLLSGQRNQSMAALDINFMNLTDDYCYFLYWKFLRLPSRAVIYSLWSLTDIQTTQIYVPWLLSKHT